MPEVKWVSPHSLHATKEGTFNEVPVLTLDEVEAWLKGQKQTILQVAEKNGYLLAGHTMGTINGTIDNLLAQVQAWEEGKA